MKKTNVTCNRSNKRNNVFSTNHNQTSTEEKEKHWKQPANILEPCKGALYEQFGNMNNSAWECWHKLLCSMLDSIRVEWISGMDPGSRATQKKTFGRSATSCRKWHGQLPRKTAREMMCDRSPLIDRHLTPEGQKQGQPRQANHRISQKNT